MSYPLRPSLTAPPSRVLLVTYDLKTPGKVYTQFYEALKEQGAWWRYLAATWLIATSKTPHEVYSALAPHLSTSHSILIIAVTRPYFGYLPKDAWYWIESHVGPS